MEVSKSDVDRPFKLNGLFLAPDASQYLLSIVQRVEPAKRQKVLRKLVDTILKQKIENNKISKVLCEAAVKECRADHCTDNTVLYVVDAFTVPYFRHSKTLNKFVPFVPESAAHERLLFPVTADAKAFLYSHRYEVIYQRMLRHQVFSKTSSLEGSSNANYRLRPIEYLLAAGSRIDSVVVLALISQLREGDWYAEDPSGMVKLNLQQAIFHEGLFPEGSVVLIEGFYDEKVLYVTGMGLPPCESSETTRRAFSVGNPFGGGPPDALAASHDAKMNRLLTTTQAGSDAMLVILGETHLDRAETLDRLTTLFGGYAACAPVAFILSGNFLSPNSAGKTCTERRIILKRLLRQLITIFKNNFPDTDSQNTSESNRSPALILIPGPEDPVYAPKYILPRPGLSLDLISNDGNRSSSSTCPSWLHLASNPCRLRVYTREIVIFRVNYSRLLIRHCVHLPTINTLDSHTETKETVEDSVATENSEVIDMDSTTVDSDAQSIKSKTTAKSDKTPFEHLGQCLARCLASQAHLLPVLGHIAPVYWYHDQALGLHPLPNLVVAIEPEPLADLNASEPGLITTGNCRFINPGRFGHIQFSSTSKRRQNSYTFKVYYPRTGIVEDSCLPSD
uniref:DNA polymerase II subunit 2 n=1 Tax=Trichobilharzia regenti TaxID=157069 RepID=A0AA85JH04_TRIRE|nr:unnamed protein product [Trichobilharzia regenti]